MRLSRLSPLVAALVFLVAGTARADGRAAVKQAEALLAQQQNDIPQAFALLREAAKLSPDDVDIAFDRANLALEHPDQGQPDDFEGYLRLEAITADQRLLRAYILAARGRTDEARAEAQGAAAADPSNQEAQGLVQALAPAGGDDTPRERDVSGRVRLYGQYDTNVSVLPDRTSTTVGSQPTISDATDLQRSAAAIGIQGDVRWTPVRGVTELTIQGGLSYLGHVNGREDSTLDDGRIKPGAGTYDFATVDASVRLAFPRERWHNALELYGTSVFIDSFSERFLTEGTLLGSSSYAVDDAKSLRLGVYALGGLRDFGDIYDARDGQRAEGGVTVDMIGRCVGAGLRGGYQAEFTDAPRFTEDGAQGMAYGRVSIDRLDALVSFVYQRRAYDDGRRDNRFGPQAQLSYALSDMLSAIATYQYLHNSSRTVVVGEADYDYSRHLVTIGIEARL